MPRRGGRRHGRDNRCHGTLDPSGSIWPMRRCGVQSSQRPCGPKPLTSSPIRCRTPARACPNPPAPPLVAREAEVATLHQWFANAFQGERHLGFITGEAGIGKTTLVDTFVAQLAGQAPLWLGHGQCIEQYGAGEAYLPLLEALG